MIAAGLLAGRFPEHREGCPSHPVIRRQEGCDEPTPEGLPSFELEIDGEVVEYNRCPLFYIDGPTLECVRWWKRSRNGLWPEGSRGLDQTATFLEAHDLIERSFREFVSEGGGGSGAES